MISHLPTLGAAMPINELPKHLEWLLADQRDLELWDPSYGDVLDGDWQPLAHEARQLLDGYSGRLGIHGPWNGLPLTCPDLRVQALVAERLKQGLEFASAIGATQMVVHSPFDFFGSPHTAHTPSAGLADEIELAHATLAPVLPIAAAIGCTLVVEVCGDTNTRPLIELVRSFDGEAVRLSLDVGHALVMQRCGGPPADQWVRDGGMVLQHLHLQDNDGLLDRHWAPGEGNLNWYALFEALADFGQQPRLLLELAQTDKIPQGAAYLVGRGLAR
ncbi:sugar phosphate isomerase/epimerase [Candidatus Gracilibacteria bacterium]|nr:sugar phosphate isomerase/epimerase [Candidatus Gracilibacteria bacterium]